MDEKHRKFFMDQVPDMEIMDPKKLREGEEVIVVCIFAEDPCIYTDNVVVKCSQCPRMVQHRPYIKDMVPYCYDCAMKRLEKDPAEAVALHPKAVGELKGFIKRKTQQ